MKFKQLKITGTWEITNKEELHEGLEYPGISSIDFHYQGCDDHHQIVVHCPKNNVDVPYETMEFDARLIMNAPVLFCRIVVLAYKEGYQWCFDLIQSITGTEYWFDTPDFNQLYKECCWYLNKLRENGKLRNDQKSKSL